MRITESVRHARFSDLGRASLRHYRPCFTLQIQLGVGKLYVQAIYDVCMCVGNICLERNTRYISLFLKDHKDTLRMEKRGENLGANGENKKNT